MKLVPTIIPCFDAGFFCRLACGVLILLSSCQPMPERADLVFVNGAEPETLDPALITAQIGMRVASSLFEGLTRHNSQGQYEPAMARDWEISDDGLVYRFFLREGVVWSNGDLVTAHDFISSWKRVLTPETGSDYVAQLYYIKQAKAYNEGTLSDFSQVGLRALDDKTLEVELENPTPFFLDLCSFMTLCPVHTKSVEQYGDDWIKPGNLIGNGPYLLEEWKLKDRIRLRRNPRYWDQQNVAMETIDVLPMDNPNAAINFFLTGGVDLIMDKGMVPPTMIDELKKKPFFHSSPFLGTYFFRFNTSKPPFNDVRVRQAFALCVKKSRIVEKITRLGEPVAASLTPPGIGQGYTAPRTSLDMTLIERENCSLKRATRRARGCRCLRCYFEPRRLKVLFLLRWLKCGDKNWVLQ